MKRLIGRAATATILVGALGLVLAYLFFGVRFSVLVGDSMGPTIANGSLVVTRPAGKPAVGDIVQFEYNGMTTMHRVVRIDAHGRFVTKGDNPRLYPEADPVHRDQVSRRYVASLPPMGGVWRYVFDHRLTVLLGLYGAAVIAWLARSRRGVDMTLTPRSDVLHHRSGVARSGPG